MTNFVLAICIHWIAFAANNSAQYGGEGQNSVNKCCQKCMNCLVYLYQKGQAENEDNLEQAGAELG